MKAVCRWLSLLCVVCLVLSCAGCFSAAAAPDYSKMRKSQLQGAAVMPHSLEDLERYSDYIVEGVLQSDAETCVSAASPLGGLQAGATKSTLYIARVLKDGGELREGDAVPLYEPYYVSDVQKEPCLFYFGGYLPSETGKAYLFFLTKNELGGYSPSGLENARFPVCSEDEADTLTRAELCLSVEANLDEYRALCREVLAAYG